MQSPSRSPTWYRPTAHTIVVVVVVGVVAIAVWTVVGPVGCNVVVLFVVVAVVVVVVAVVVDTVVVVQVLHAAGHRVLQLPPRAALPQ